MMSQLPWISSLGYNVAQCSNLMLRCHKYITVSGQYTGTGYGHKPIYFMMSLQLLGKRYIVTMVNHPLTVMTVMSSTITEVLQRCYYHHENGPLFACIHYILHQICSQNIQGVFKTEFIW